MEQGGFSGHLAAWDPGTLSKSQEKEREKLCLLKLCDVFHIN